MLRSLVKRRNRATVQKLSRFQLSRFHEERDDSFKRLQSFKALAKDTRTGGSLPSTSNAGASMLAQHPWWLYLPWGVLEQGTPEEMEDSEESDSKPEDGELPKMKKQLNHKGFY